MEWMEVTAKRDGVSFCGDKSVLKLIAVQIAQFYEYTKNCWIVHFKWVNSMLCKLYLNKAVTTEDFHGNKRQILEFYYRNKTSVFKHERILFLI